jgi:hypothetical protein
MYIVESSQSSFESFIKNDEITSITYFMDLVDSCSSLVGTDE